MCPTLIQREWHNTRPRGSTAETLHTSGVNDLLTVQEHSAFLDDARERVLMLEQAIMELQNIEQSLARKTLSDLKIHLVLRSCLKELRALSVACRPARVISLATDRRTGSSS